MPFFQKPIAIETTPLTLYESSMAYLHSAISSLEAYVPSPDDVQVYVDKVAENKALLLTALFVIFSIVLCVPLTGALEEMKQEKTKTKKKEEEVHVESKELADIIQKMEEKVQVESEELADIIQVNQKDIVELTATSSSDSAGDDDDEHDESSNESEGDQDGDISDDASVEETYNDFLAKAADEETTDWQAPPPVKVLDDDSAATGAVTTVTASTISQEDDVSMLTETPTATPPASPVSSSRRPTGLKKRLSLKLSNRNLSFNNLKKMVK